MEDEVDVVVVPDADEHSSDLVVLQGEAKNTHLRPIEVDIQGLEGVVEYRRCFSQEMMFSEN